MFSQKTQGTAEYLVALAIVIVIALVVVGVMNWFPAIGTGIAEQQSRAYWQTTAPLAVEDWTISQEPTEAAFVVQNTSTDKISVTEITVDGTQIEVDPDVEIAAGSKATITGVTGKACSRGLNYQYELKIDYDVVGGISGKTLSGKKLLVATCNASECNCGPWIGSSCGSGSCIGWRIGQTRSCTPSACDSESQCSECNEACCNKYCVDLGNPSGTCYEIPGSCACEVTFPPEMPGIIP